MHLTFVAVVVVASLVGVSVHAEAPDIKSSRPTEASVKRHFRIHDPNEEERSQPIITSLVSYWAEHGFGKFIQRLKDERLDAPIEPDSKRFKLNLENDHSTEELIRLRGINKEMGEEPDVKEIPEALQRSSPKPPIESQPSPDFLKKWPNDKEETATLRQMLWLDEEADKDKAEFILQFWRSYVSYYNVMFFSHQITLREALSDVYKHEGMVKIITTVKGARSQAEIYLQVAFLMVHPDENIFLNTHILGLIKEARVYIEMPPEKNINLLGFLDYDDTELINMAHNALKSVYHKNSINLVLQALRKSWRDAKLTSQQLFVRLGLDKDKKNILFESPCFQEWLQYVLRYEKLSYVKVLDKVDGFLKMLQEAEYSPTTKLLTMSYLQYLKPQPASPLRDEKIQVLHSLSTLNKRQPRRIRIQEER